MSDTRYQMEDLIVGILVRQFPEWEGRSEEALRFVRDPANAAELKRMLGTVAELGAGFTLVADAPSTGYSRLLWPVIALLLGCLLGGGVGMTFSSGDPSGSPKPEGTPIAGTDPISQSEIDAQIQKFQGDWERTGKNERVVKSVRGRQSTVTYYSAVGGTVTAKSRTDFSICKVGGEWRFVYTVVFEKGKYSGRTFRGQYPYRFEPGDKVFHEIAKPPYVWKKLDSTDYSEIPQ